MNGLDCVRDISLESRERTIITSSYIVAVSLVE